MYVELHIDKIRYADRFVYSVVVHDVSSRREYEDRLLTAKENAEQIARFKSTLLANMSHEIRTPLSSILGWTTVLNEEVPEEQRELLALIKQSGHRLQRTLDSVLELAHLDANARLVQPRLVDLFEEVQAVASDMQLRAKRKGIALTVEHRCSDAFTRLDVTCLRRVLNHLVDNALKFTSKGSVVIAVNRSATELRIDIRDTGVGISKDFMPSIFEEFKQESDGLNRDHEGNGLGLPIVRRLVRLMNGRITVQSRRGEGSTFSIILPTEPAMSRSAQVA
jgi:signal transduction histidine kinase